MRFEQWNNAFSVAVKCNSDVPGYISLFSPRFVVCSSIMSKLNAHYNSKKHKRIEKTTFIQSFCEFPLRFTFS